MSMRNFLENIKQIMSDAYSVVVQMDLSKPKQIYRVWTINKVGDENYKNFSGLRFAMPFQTIKFRNSLILFIHSILQNLLLKYSNNTDNEPIIIY